MGKRLVTAMTRKSIHLFAIGIGLMNVIALVGCGKSEPSADASTPTAVNKSEGPSAFKGTTSTPAPTQAAGGGQIDSDQQKALDMEAKSSGQ